MTEEKGYTINGKFFKIHGIEFERTGDCNGCGLCGCDKCPHAEIKEDKTYFCKIYDTRDRACEYCTNTETSDWYRGGKEVTHTMCIDFPNHPFTWTLKDGHCSYKFTPRQQTDVNKLTQLKVTNGYSN